MRIAFAFASELTPTCSLNRRANVVRLHHLRQVYAAIVSSVMMVTTSTNGPRVTSNRSSNVARPDPDAVQTLWS